MAAIHPAKIAACLGSAKVMEPRWYSLNKTVSYILAHSPLSGACHVPFFMCKSNAEILAHLMELERSYVHAHHE